MPAKRDWLYGFSQQGHSIYYAVYRIILATKYKRRILKGGIGQYLKIGLSIMGKHYPDIKIFEAITGENYLYVQVSIPPSISVSQLVDILKIDTAKALRNKFRFLSKLHYGGGEIWSAGCLVSTREINEEIIRKYIQHQGDEDYGQGHFVF